MNNYLNYCKVCKHRQENIRYGVICGLTERLPSFKEECENYTFEEGVFENLVEQKKDFYQKIISRDIASDQGSLNIRITKKISGNRIQHYSHLPSVIEIHDSKKINGIIGFTGIAFALYLFYPSKDTQFSWTSLLFISPILLISFYFLFLAFSNKPVLVLNDKGISHKNKLIPWTNIILTSFQTESSKLKGRTKQAFIYFNVNY